jgi:hypothetical protein
LQNGNLLLTIAEVAVTFAGFASLISILGRRSSRDSPVVQAGRLRGLIISSLVVVAFALFPFVPHSFGSSPLAVWRISSAVLVVAGGGLAVVAFGNLGRVHSADSISPGFVWRGAVISTILVVAEALLVGNALGAFSASAAAIYIVSLLLLLGLAGFMYANLLLSFLAAPGS